VKVFQDPGAIPGASTNIDADYN